MEVYILDSLYRRIDVVDKFESLIWTERVREFGDFELILQSTQVNREKFLTGVHLAITESYRVMTVEMVEDSTDSEGREILTVKGRSLEAILLDRVARDSLSDLTSNPKWSITDTPTEIAKTLFNTVCILGQLSDGDIIPLLSEGSTIFPEDTIPEPSEVFTYEIDPMDLYTAIKNVADIYNFGFRIVRNLDEGELYFDIYTGSDRTTQQTEIAAVVFSKQLDNLQNTASLTSTSTYKNVAYVLTPVGSQVVYGLDVSVSVDGFDRHVVLVKADDITDTNPFIATGKMIQRGKEELAKHRALFAFDGEINQNGQYKYGVDYHLGDLVELQNTEGTVSKMQVTEQIFVSDQEGDRSYPTLSLNEVINPGSWASWEFSTKTWSEFGETEFWEDMSSGPEAVSWQVILERYATWQDLLDAHGTWASVIDS